MMLSSAPIRYLCFIGVALIGFSGTMHAQSDWELRKTEDGISAYTRDVEGSKYKAYQIRTTIKATPEACVSILRDPEALPIIFDDTKAIDVLTKVPNGDFIFYMHTNAPFPVKDRDGVYRNRYAYDADQKTARIDIECVTGYAHKKGVIRIEYCQGYWEFRDIGQGEVALTHEFHANAGGKIPAWLVNKKTTKSPIESVRRMAELLQNPAYQNPSLEFVNDR